MGPRAAQGRLIVLEGLDGVGKTTLSHRLATALGAALDSTPGQGIRGAREAFEAEHAACRVARSLAYGATVVAAGRRVEAALEAGHDVVLDRYWLSTLVHAPPPARPALAAMAAHVRPADLTLYLRLPLALRAARLQGRGASLEDLRTLQEHGELEAAYLAGLDHAVAGQGVVVDVVGDADSVLMDVLARLSPRVAA